MKKYVFSVLCAVILAVTTIGICAGAEESTRVPAQKMSQEAETVTVVKSKKVTAKTTTAKSTAKNSKATTEAVKKETSETVTNDRENEDDPFANADGWDIPKSFYIGGGVIGVFIIASAVVLIMGKPKEK